MTRQVAYRVMCPICGDWAQLRVAYPFAERENDPHIEMFACINQTDEGHAWPAIPELVKLIPDLT